MAKVYTVFMQGAPCYFEGLRNVQLQLRPCENQLRVLVYNYVVDIWISKTNDWSVCRQFTRDEIANHPSLRPLPTRSPQHLVVVALATSLSAQEVGQTDFAASLSVPAAS